MTATNLGEMFRSPEKTQSDTPRVEITYLYQSASQSDVFTQVLSDTSATLGGLQRTSIRVAPHDETETHWQAAVEYAKQDSPEDETSFQIGGGNERIFKSLETTNYGPVDNDGLIGVGKDSVEGVDIQVPTFDFSFIQYVDPGDVDDTYIASLYNLAFKTNQSTYRGFAAGSVLFRGASGSIRGTSKCPLAFHFSASPNVAFTAKRWFYDPGFGFTLDSADENITKKGWEYFEPFYGEFVDSANGFQVVKLPISYHVHKVYEEGDFSILP